MEYFINFRLNQHKTNILLHAVSYLLRGLAANDEYVDDDFILWFHSRGSSSSFESVVCCRPVFANRLVSPIVLILDVASAASLFADDVVAGSSVVRIVVVCFSCVVDRVCSMLVVVVVFVVGEDAIAAAAIASQDL